MDTADVWRLVERARGELGDAAAGPDLVAEQMVELLAREAPERIVAFAQPLTGLFYGPAG
ncbi:hypothetical protein [Dactylosporangium sp. CA-139066]|uniref:hypothetical protein n=1 Tax=Dactylosporangium sp. CA-139066 TaxID=3239930 RepID=UPI003D8FB4B6